MKLFLLFLALASVSGAPRDFATVKVLRVIKRSSPEESPAYRVEVSGSESKVRLNLRSPADSIFTPNFQYLEASEGENGLKFEDATPSKRELQEIESNFYTDVGENAAVSLKRNVNSEFEMNGRINDMSIVNRGNMHELRRQAPEGRFTDYIEYDRNLTRSSKTSKATTTANPELFIVWDYDNSELFDFDRAKIIDYLGVFFHAVNNRYATASNPKIAFRITGVLAVRSRSAQSYMENNAVPGGYDINKVLEDFAKWLYANSGTYSKYDLAALISGADMKMQDSSGAWSSGVAGLAYMKAACWNHPRSQRYLGSSVSEDRGGYYNGVFTVAHELAHNLGAPHDGDSGESDATACPWSDGYIMSYEGWGTKNKFYFSSCSLSLMKELVDSDQGACTRSAQSDTEEPISEDNVGDRYSMKDLCVKHTKSNEAVPDPDTKPDALCKNLKCRYPYEGRPGWYRIVTLNHPPGDNSACGNGGKCIDGDCVGSS